MCGDDEITSSLRGAKNSILFTDCFLFQTKLSDAFRKLERELNDSLIERKVFCFKFTFYLFMSNFHRQTKNTEDKESFDGSSQKFCAFSISKHELQDVILS
jgi:hypothetical protein